TVISAAGDSSHLVLAADGTYTYSVAESVALGLGVGQTKVDVFTVTSLDGTTKQVSFTIHGASANHPAVIGDPTVGDVTEDDHIDSAGNLTAAGSIPISDADPGQATFQTAVATAAGDLGSLTLHADGQYVYSVANAATQSLGAGAIKIDTFTVTSADGTTKQVSFTIHGVDDAPTAPVDLDGTANAVSEGAAAGT